MVASAGQRNSLGSTALLTLTIAQFGAAAALGSIQQYGAELVETTLERRKVNTTDIPAPISIAPSQYWDGIDGPWSSFALQVGTPAQNVRVFASTAAPITWTIGADGCPPGYVADCANSRGFLFLPNQSLTWVPNSRFNFALEDNLGMDTNGNAGFDTEVLGWQGSGGPTVSHATVFNVASSQYWLGAFGLNPLPTNFTTFTNPQPSFMQQLLNNNTIPSLSYAYTAGNQYRLNKVFGSLTLGGYDLNRFGNNNITVDMYSDVSRDLLVYVQGINSGTTNLLPSGTISMYIDSTIATIWLPEDACKAFETAFGLVYNEDYGLYLMNSSQRTTLQATNPSVTFTLGANQTGGSTIAIELPYKAFDLTVQYPMISNPNTSYYFPLNRAANDTQYTLGRTFLQEAYLIVDYERQHFKVAPCTWNQAAIQSPLIQRIKSTNSTKNGDDNSNGGGGGISAGTIAGVVVAIVAAIAILAGLLWFFRRRKRTQKQRASELEAKEQSGAAKESSDNENKPFISNPMGGELGGGEIHELTAPHKPFAQEMESPHKVDPNKAGYSEMGGGEYFGPGKGFAHEMQGNDQPVYEMAGSDVHEMPTHERRLGEDK
ncbi:hypothetical protein LTR86_005934 [Recurvomyces mirabilis]|nr:hypothetical protein LTR86_005934 [Recurvomyces mirabilis]